MASSFSQRNASTHATLEWSGVAARIRRGGKSVRAGRRSALLSVITAAYANASRGSSTTSAQANRNIASESAD